MFDVEAADGSWDVIGSVDGSARVFLRHVAREEDARAFADSLRGGLLSYDRGRWTDALQELRPVAEAGCSDARTMIGTLYQLGLGVEVDQDAARVWYELAASRGDALAAWNLGTMLSGAAS